MTKDTRYQRQMPEEEARKLIRERLEQGLVETISGKEVGTGKLKESDDIPGEYVGTKLQKSISHLVRESNARSREPEWESVWMKGSSGETFSGNPYDTWCTYVLYHIPSRAIIQHGHAYSGCDDRSFEQVRVYGENKESLTALIKRIRDASNVVE